MPDFREIGMNALANMEAIPGEDSDDAVYDDAYCLAFDAIRDAGCHSCEAADIAREIAQCIAQP